jgi:hypothetical protein
VNIAADAIAEQATGGRPSRTRSFLAAVAIGAGVAVLTYRVVRRDRTGDKERDDQDG